MEETVVVNIRRTKDYDVYIGRKKNSKFHFGNPFYIAGSMTRDDSIANFGIWLRGWGHTELEQKRRWWILRNLHKLEGQRLGCFCAPKRCHGDVYVKLLKERKTKCKKKRKQKSKGQ